jgi:hypothetical protein
MFCIHAKRLSESNVRMAKIVNIIKTQNYLGKNISDRVIYYADRLSCFRLAIIIFLQCLSNHGFFVLLVVFIFFCEI